MDSVVAHGAGETWAGQARLILRRTGLFGALSDTELERLTRAAEAIHAPGGAVLIEEGEPGNDLYVLVDGALQIYTHLADGREVVLARLTEPGAYVGEQALLSAETRRRNASVRAFASTTL